MQIVVCVKLVDGELSPFDASALECALKLRDADRNTEVTVLCMGRTSCREPLEALTRLGVSRPVLLSDSVFAGADTLATAYVLSLAVQKLGADLILCGRQSTDGDTAQTGPALAALLGIPVITNVLKLDVQEQRVRCMSRFGEESASLPALLTVERIAALRFPRLGAGRKDAELWDAAVLGADPERCGLKGSPTRVLKTRECRTGLRRCRFVRLERLDEIITEALEKPAEKSEPRISGPKLPEVFCVGTGATEWAHRIAEHVRVLEEDTPLGLAVRIRREKPDVVLWDGGLWGRRTAPQVAALLRTGLCADCTDFVVDGQSLQMVRPAFGGSLIATVVCRRKPQMATVRPVGAVGEQVIVGVGAGAAAQFPQIREWAERRGYGLAASRALVDTGLVPYEYQVGLTGKTIRPAVYVAIGISGAVQHTCAIEQAGTIIAVNPDKSARIFDCADIGICDVFR